MDWIELTTQEQLQGIANASHPVLIFKHSTRCSISVMAKNRLDEHAINSSFELPCYYLDLLKYRELSDSITNQYKVYHESPQVLLLAAGECLYDASHQEIRGAEIDEQLELIYKH